MDRSELVLAYHRQMEAAGDLHARRADSEAEAEQEALEAEQEDLLKRVREMMASADLE